MRVIELLLSDEFEQWLDQLGDVRARTKIVARLRSLAAGNFGDVKAIGAGVTEMRMHFGPGYRLYYVRRGTAVYLLLVGGTKHTQRADIVRAKAMAEALKEKDQ